MSTIRINKRFFTVFVTWATLSLLVLTSPAGAQSAEFAQLETFVQAEMKTTNVPGLAIAIVKGNRVVFARGFGVASVETKAPVTTDTLFQIGSVTKSFTAAAVLSLVEQSVLKLDQPVGVYINGLHPKIARLTLHQLLSHTSGLQDEPAEFGSQDEAALGAYQRAWKEDYCLLEPGLSFSYSNSGYSLAGLAIQERSGKPYAEVMDALLFKPLGMNHATFRPTVAMTYPLAIGHRVENGTPVVVRPLPNDTRLWPAGTCYVSANEMARFAVAFLNEGRLAGKQMLSAETIRKMATPVVDIPSLPDATRYGYGLMQMTRRGLQELGHEGGMTGYTAIWRAYPQERLAVIVLSNKDSQQLTSYVDKVLDLMTPAALASQDKPQPALPMDEVEMKKYVGVYRAPNRFTAEVILKDGQLRLKQFNQEAALTKIGLGRFAVATPAPREIAFRLDAKGAPLFMQQFYWAFKKVK